MNTRLAHFLSVVFHPLLMPTLLFGLLLFQVPGVLRMDVFSDSLRLSLLILIFVGTFLMPSVLIYYLFRMGYVRDLQLTNLADRRLPYFLTALVYLGLVYLFTFRMYLAPEIGILLGSTAISILLVGLISLSWQISAHSVGIGGVVGVVVSILLKYEMTELFIPLAGLVFLTGLVSSARLKLNAHTPAQVGAGLALGLGVSLMTVYWFV